MKVRKSCSGMPLIQLRSDVNEAVCQRGFHVKLYLGFYDFNRRRVRRVHREDGGGDKRGA